MEPLPFSFGTVKKSPSKKLQNQNTNLGHWNSRNNRVSNTETSVDGPNLKLKIQRERINSSVLRINKDSR